MSGAIDENTTDWSTADLEAVIQAAFEHRGVDTDRCKLRIEHTRASKWRDSKWRYRGRCWSRLNGCSKNEIYLGVPKPEDIEAFNIDRFSQVALHEIDHLLGLKHKDMLHSTKLSTPFTEGLTVREAQ